MVKIAWNAQFSLKLLKIVQKSLKCLKWFDIASYGQNG